MLARWLVLLVLLASAGAAVAAPVPARGALDLVTHELGWRFRQEFAVWPGLYWRGPERPPVAASPEDPATWGVLRLGGPLDAPPPVVGGLTELTAPLTEARPSVDGLLGSDEWAAAAQTVEELEQGEACALYAQHTADTLYVCLACPSSLTVRDGQAAELYLNPAEGVPIAGAARLLRLRADRGQKPQLQSCGLKSGAWTVLPEVKDAPAWRGGVSGRGDGAWGFAVYEWAVPLAFFAADGTAPATPGQFRFMARLQRSGSGGAVGEVRAPDQEELVWPDSRSSWTNGPRAPVGLRPDAWPALQLQGGNATEALDVPVATRTIKVDGQIGLKEWADAHLDTYSLPGGQWRRVWLTRDVKNLYIAVRVRLARGLRAEEACRVFVDPIGDGGLQPRGDDLQYRLRLGPDTAPEAFRREGEAWVAGDLGDVKAASYPVSAYESTYEWALPLAALGPDLRPHLAVEVIYGLPQ